jgi:hypothetical protein
MIHPSTDMDRPIQHVPRCERHSQNVVFFMSKCVSKVLECD